MITLRGLLLRVRALARRQTVEQELDEELRFHVDMEAAKNEREGMSPEEARRAALVSFGGVERHKEGVRDGRAWSWLERLAGDLRYALRGLRLRPGFTLAVAATLALGIGANAAMFGVVDRLLFRAPPLMKAPARAHRLYFVERFRGEEFANDVVPYARYVEITRAARTLERTALFAEPTLGVGVGGETRELRVGVVSATFFGFFDAPPALGRYFTGGEDVPPRGAPVAVLGWGAWQTRYGGRRDVLGQAVRIGATTYTIVGIAPKGFVGLWPEAPPAAFVPASSYGAEAGSANPFLRGKAWWRVYSWTWASMIAERKPGVSLAAIDADLTRAFLKSHRAQQLTSSLLPPPAESKPRAIAASILSERGPNESSEAKVATWVSGVALIVWLIACTNVANLLLARALRRRREIAVRLALGVSRARLAAQLLTESLLLALLGGIAGVAVAQWGGALLRARFPSAETTATVLGDPRTILFAGAATLLAGLLAGLAPLGQTRRVDLNRDLRGGAREGRMHRSRVGAVLLVLQATLSVVLLVGAGLFVRSLLRVRDVPLGYDPAHVAEVDLNMRGVELDSARAVALRQRLLAAAQALPGVTHASLQLTAPFWRNWSVDLKVVGIDSVSRLGDFYLNAVSPDYFATMGTRILRGRGISDADRAGAPLAMVVSRAMARKLWPSRDPLGECVRVGADTAPCTYVVGVAENIKNSSLEDDPTLFYYLAAAQFHPERAGLFVRMSGDASQSRESLRRALQPLMPSASYVNVTPLAEIVASRTRSWELGATMFVLFGLLALVLAAAGLYAVIAYDVTQRTHELGVRVALGARSSQLVAMVVGDGARVAVAGIALGLAISLAAAGRVEPLLFQESARDPVVYAGVALVLLAAAALACALPARRAAGVEPARTLRED